MKSFALALTAMIALLPITARASSFAQIPNGAPALAAPANADNFTFIVTGDNRSTGHGYPMPPSFDEICTEIGLIHPSLVLWTGDVIEGYGDSAAEANAEYDVFLKGAALTGVPVFNAPGNHEFSLDKTLLPIYETRIGPLYGSFDYGNSHFIALNTNAVNADGTIKPGTLDDAQWQWLENDLKSTSAKNIFVFMHHYPFGPPDPDDPTVDSGWKDMAQRDRFHALMAKYHVRAVFAGHEHLYWHAVKDGVDYYISGGAGAPLDASPDKGGFLHYLVVHVDGDKISTDILQPWHLSVTYPKGDGNGQRSETAWVENTNSCAVDVANVSFHIKAPAAPGLMATAALNYKGKNSKPLTAEIVSQTPSADGKSLTVVVRTEALPARTVEVSVTPVALTGSTK